MPGRFDSKVAVVTGATSGIGEAAARRFASEGAKVVCIGRDTSRGERIVESIHEKDGVAIFVRADATKDGQVRSAIDKAVETFGRIDVLFNNAGVLLIRSCMEMTEEEWDSTINTNLKSVFLFSKHALPFLKQTKGVIVNTGSELGIIGAPKYSGYCASKGGVVLFTKALAIECAPWGVRVNCVCPGATNTGMLEGEFVHYTTKEPDRFPDKERTMNFLLDMIPLRRISTADDIANVVLFLASDEARQMTGSVVSVDAGTTAQ